MFWARTDDIASLFAIFIGYIPTNESLYTSLQEYGYILIFKPTLSLPDGRVKGNIDAELVLHTMIEYPNYDKAVIVTGDGDFHCLIEYLKKQDRLGKLIIPNRNKFSSLLRKFATDMVFMNNLRAKLENKWKRGITAGRAFWIASYRDSIKIYNISNHLSRIFSKKGREWYF